MTQKLLILTRIAIIACLLLDAGAAAASSWDIGYRNLSQTRKSRFASYQEPIYQYFSLGASELPYNLNLQTDFMGFADAITGANNFDLYQALVHIEPVKNFTIDGGRQWIGDGLDANLMDGLKLGLASFDSHIGGNIYAGIPRYLEQGDFHNVREQLVVGGNLDLLDVKDTAMRFSAQWFKADATRNDYRYNDTIYLGLSGSRQFSDAWSTPRIYGDVEFDVAGKLLDVGTLGLNFYPHWRVALTFEGNRFDVNRRLNNQTIFGDTFTGSIYQGREAMQIKLAKNFNFVEDFSYFAYKVPGLGDKNGYKAGAGLDYFWEAAKLSTHAEYYYMKSYGGTVNGGYAELANSYLKHLYGDIGVDVSRYSKITNEKNTALSVVGEVGWAFAKRVKLALGGEFNRNVWFNRDCRVTVNLEMAFTKGEYTPEKRSKRVNRKFHEVM